MVPVCGKLESDPLSELDAADRQEMLRDAWDSAEPASLRRWARECVPPAGAAQLFHRRPQRDSRAWEIPVGATAPQAAGVIHTDFGRRVSFSRRKFIRSKILKQFKTEGAIKAAGQAAGRGKGLCHEGWGYHTFLVSMRELDSSSKAGPDG